MERLVHAQRLQIDALKAERDLALEKMARLLHGGRATDTDAIVGTEPPTAGSADPADSGVAANASDAATDGDTAAVEGGGGGDQESNDANDVFILEPLNPRLDVHLSPEDNSQPRPSAGADQSTTVVDSADVLSGE